MRKLIGAILFLVVLPGAAWSKSVPCPTGVDPTASNVLSDVMSQHCATKLSHGYPIPDPLCTPGAINPTVTLQVLEGAEFKTGCERNMATSAATKNRTYAMYSIKRPAKNVGARQTCELDHLVSLEIGGADTLDNIWPQCGPARVKLAKRFFKVKDTVENYLAAMVRSRGISIEDAQHGIATDWTQYIAASSAYFKDHSKKGFGSDQ